MIKRILILIFLAGTYNLSGQTLSDFLKQVADNNPEIKAYEKLLEARKLEARTGITPPDPFISAGIMPGKDDDSGTKRTWSVSQSFDFPTKYILQKKISKNAIVLAENEFNHGILLKLLEAKLSVFDLIYNTRQLNILNTRKEEYNRLQGAWKKMLDNGESNIMDYNKLMLELSAINLEITRREGDIAMIREKLIFISGSDGSLPVINNYPEASVPDPERLINEKSVGHPAFLIPEIEYQLSLQEIKLSRTGSLPEFQVGYSSERLPVEAFAGPVVGLSIPLWANSNRVKAASAEAAHLSASRDAVLLKLKSQIRNEFVGLRALESSISEIREILESGEGTKFIDIALSSGEISIITYFLYLEVIYDAEDKLLELENEYQRSLAKLFDHELIK